MLEEAGKSDQILIDGDTDSYDDEKDKFLQSEIEKLKVQVESDKAKLITSCIIAIKFNLY